MLTINRCDSFIFNYLIGSYLPTLNYIFGGCAGIKENHEEHNKQSTSLFGGCAGIIISCTHSISEPNNFLFI